MKFKFKNKFLKINFEIKLTKDFKKKVIKLIKKIIWSLIIDVIVALIVNVIMSRLFYINNYEKINKMQIV